MATHGTALPMQLDEISNAGLPGPTLSRRRAAPFGAGRLPYPGRSPLQTRRRSAIWHGGEKRGARLRLDRCWNTESRSEGAVPTCDCPRAVSKTEAALILTM